MMVDNYLLHTLEAQFEQQEEDQYKKQMLSHYSEQGSVSVYTCMCSCAVVIMHQPVVS